MLAEACVGVAWAAEPESWPLSQVYLSSSVSRHLYILGRLYAGVAFFTWWGRGHLFNREYFVTVGHLICFDYQSLLLREPFRDDAAWDEQCLAFMTLSALTEQRVVGRHLRPHHPELGVQCVVSWRNSQGGAA